jgi:radical SAM superfamily enzyme YgiQ (UPF0313 family)
LKKIVLVAVNAKFIHSNPAIYALIKYCPQPITPLEFTVNDNFNYILSEIYDTQPDVLGFSCYIWNIKIVLSLVSAVKKIIQGVTVILGGPEVSFDGAKILGEYPADIIVSGEGEETLREILSGAELAEIKGITYKTDANEIITNPPRQKLDLSAVPFFYNENNLPENKIIYYESSRGCPFSCGYCLSHNEKPVRFLPLARVFNDLDFFIKNRVTQVKFTDRTFNCDAKRALQIWQYLIENDNGCTNFHFEVSADLLNDESIKQLKKAKDGLFQFEIGIQSTNPETLKLTNRTANTAAAIENIKKLKTCDNIHIHLDLIAGLPAEGYKRFKESFNTVYAQYPDMLQLGFLKLIKGSQLRENADEYGIVYNETPPYEVLSTNAITYEELKNLKSVEQAVDLLYNSGNFKKSLKYVQGFFASPFDFYEAFSQYWRKNGFHRASQGLPILYEIFCTFSQPFCDAKILTNYIKFDWYGSGNQKTFPLPLYEATEENPETINALYKATSKSKRFPIKKFDFDVESNDPQPVYLLFEHIGKPRPGSQKKYVAVQKLADA